MTPTRLLIFFAALALPGRAFSFPENTRHGYPSCASCHVAPTGGGALTPYGRGASEAFMSSWAFEGEAQPDWGYLGVPDWLMLGGDQRGVAYSSKQPDGAFPNPTYIPMQMDGELAVQSPWAPNLTLDVSGGVYGPQRVVEYRRYYLKAMLSPTLGMRVGRFMPAYGVNVPDHTTVTRSALGFGEGQESYNAEAFWLPPRGELEVAAVMGQSAILYGDDVGRVSTLRTDDMVGASGRAAVYLGSSASVGISALSLRDFAGATRRSVGPFAQLGLTPQAFVLAEADRVYASGTAPQTVAMLKVGSEVVPGLVSYAQAEALDGQHGSRLGLQWQPRPHWEGQVEYRMADAETFGGLPRNSVVALLHHWL